MDVMHERVAGLDVHKKTVVACVRIVAGGKVSRECRTFETTTAGLEALLAWLAESGCTHVAMEATGVYWKPVWNILSDGKFELILANAAHIKNVPGRKTDVNDATWIADLTAFGLIKASFVPEETIQDLRSLTRTRKQLVREPQALDMDSTVKPLYGHQEGAVLGYNVRLRSTKQGWLDGVTVGQTGFRQVSLPGRILQFLGFLRTTLAGPFVPQSVFRPLPTQAAPHFAAMPPRFSLVWHVNRGWRKASTWEE